MVIILVNITIMRGELRCIEVQRSLETEVA